LEEAKRVVDYLKQIWLTVEDRPTIGVVTFNDAQREAIEDLLEAEASRDPEVQAAYDRELTRAKDGQDVGFFVKSLEAVQGDERDVILFSTTYGRREDGRFIRSFLGPINQQGGERRLNVAITRARLWVRIFTSLPIAELSSALTPGTVETQDAAGRAMLQLYLAYAEHISGGDYAGANGILRRAMELAGAIGEHPGSAGEEESEFEAEVRDALGDALGCQIDTQVSSGSFRIDLGVRAPESSNYILGIECDGKAYHSAPSARAYDYWRQTVLEQRGWQIHRIWSSVWRTDRIGEITKVKDRIERILGTNAGNKG
jgi:very-short-patch-repair endonuclease